MSSESETYTASHVVQEKWGGQLMTRVDLALGENGLGEHFQCVDAGPVRHGHLYPGRCQLSQLNPPQINAVTVKSK